MVLVADHEITSSAFAARITASTGASLPGCLLTVSRPFRGRCTATPPGACAPSSTT
jgi:citrate synthase